MTAFQAMKRGNAMLVLRLVREGGCSRAELARQTGLTRAAITGIVDELIADGLLREGEIAKTAVGRHPTVLELDPDGYYAAGVDLSREDVTLCLLDFLMRPVTERSWSRDVPQAQVMEELIATVLDWKASHRLLGVGVVAPGPIDVARGEILAPKGLEPWHGFRSSALAEAVGLPVILEKDTAALALAEKGAFGARSSFLVLLADHGLGGGFVYRGRLFGSSEGFGCEIGHVSIDVNGPLCHCGNRGCAELYASIPQVLAYAKERGRDGNWQTLLEGVAAGDAVCRAALMRQAEALSAACVGAVNLLEPERIVLEGALGEAYELLKPSLEDALATRCFTRSSRRVRVERSSLTRNGRAVAAANLLLENFFEEKDHDSVGRV